MMDDSDLELLQVDRPIPIKYGLELHQVIREAWLPDYVCNSLDLNGYQRGTRGFTKK